LLFSLHYFLLPNLIRIHLTIIKSCLFRDKPLHFQHYGFSLSFAIGFLFDISFNYFGKCFLFTLHLLLYRAHILILSFHDMILHVLISTTYSHFPIGAIQSRLKNFFSKQVVYVIQFYQRNLYNNRIVYNFRDIYRGLNFFYW